MREIRQVFFGAWVALILGMGVGTTTASVIPEALYDKASSEGSVRVIVQLRASTVPEGQLESAEAVASQRQGIATMRGAVLAELAGTSHRTIREFETTRLNVAMCFNKVSQRYIKAFDEINDERKLAIAFAGLDPLKTMLPLIDKRLTAFAGLKFKRETLAVKLAELKSARKALSFRNHLFELNVLGDLALRGVLVDIEDPATAVDGAMNLDGRDILVEATNTIQRVIPDFTGVFCGNPDLEIDQVVKKLRKKDILIYLPTYTMSRYYLFKSCFQSTITFLMEVTYEIILEITQPILLSRIST